MASYPILLLDRGHSSKDLAGTFRDPKGTPAPRIGKDPSEQQEDGLPKSPVCRFFVKSCAFPWSSFWFFGCRASTLATQPPNPPQPANLPTNQSQPTNHNQPNHNRAQPTNHNQSQPITTNHNQSQPTNHNHPTNHNPTLNAPQETHLQKGGQSLTRVPQALVLLDRQPAPC